MLVFWLESNTVTFLGMAEFSMMSNSVLRRHAGRRAQSWNESRILPHIFISFCKWKIQRILIFKCQLEKTLAFKKFVIFDTTTTVFSIWNSYSILYSNIISWWKLIQFAHRCQIRWISHVSFIIFFSNVVHSLGENFSINTLLSRQ